MTRESKNETGTTRRRVLKTAALAAAAGVAPGALASAAQQQPGRVKDGRFKQSIVHWCFKDHWDVEQTARVATQLGCRSVELIDPQHWPILKKYGLTCAIAGSHGFVKGM